MKVTYIRDPWTGQPAFLVEEEDITELKKIQHELEVQRLHISFLANISHGKHMKKQQQQRYSVLILPPLPLSNIRNPNTIERYNRNVTAFTIYRCQF